MAKSTISSKQGDCGLTAKHEDGQSNTMNLKHMVIPFSKMEGDANSEEGIFEGYGSVFDNVDSHGDIVRRGAFNDSLRAFQKEGLMPSMYWMHKMDEPIGDWLEMREDENGLYVKGRLWIRGDRAVPNAIKAYNMMMGTGKKGLSIGYFTEEQEASEYDGGSVNNLLKVRLLETSVVGWGSNPLSNVSNVKSLLGEDGSPLSKREVERKLRDAGLSRNEAKAFIAGGYDAAFRDEKSADESEERDASLESDLNQASLDRLYNILKG